MESLGMHLWKPGIHMTVQGGRLLLLLFPVNTTNTLAGISLLWAASSSGYWRKRSALPCTAPTHCVYISDWALMFPSGSRLYESVL